MNKERKQRIELKTDNRWLQDKTNRFFANLFVRLISKTNVQPNQITLFSLGTGLLSAYLIIFDTTISRVSASIILFLSLVLDSADGQLARLRKQTSNLGDWFDKVTDRLKESLIIIAITYTAFNRLLEYKVWYIGMGVIFLINFMYYNLELLKKLFNLRETAFPQNNLMIRNILSFGYGERIFYLLILVAFNQLIFSLWLLGIGCIFHILLNSYIAIKRRGV